ncbi:MAG: hypothetical protein WBE76_18030 [Terracidiphilus sp.]
MFIVEGSLNSKSAASRLVQDSCDFPMAFDSKFFAGLIGRWNQEFNADLRSNWRTLAAENQGAIERNVAGEASLRVLCAIVPMKNNGKLQLVTDCIPTLNETCWHQAQTHRWNERMVISRAKQEGECLKIVGAGRTIGGPVLSSKVHMMLANRLNQQGRLLSATEKQSRFAVEKKVCFQADLAGRRDYGTISQKELCSSRLAAKVSPGFG